MIEKIDYEEDTINLRDEIIKPYIVPVVYYKRIHAVDKDTAIDYAYRDANQFPFINNNFEVLEDKAYLDD